MLNFLKGLGLLELALSLPSLIINTDDGHQHIADEANDSSDKTEEGWAFLPKGYARFE
jgi:hypothetical protein